MKGGGEGGEGRGGVVLVNMSSWGGVGSDPTWYDPVHVGPHDEGSWELECNVIFYKQIGGRSRHYDCWCWYNTTDVFPHHAFLLMLTNN